MTGASPQLEAQVLQKALARGLVSAAQVAAAQLQQRAMAQAGGQQSLLSLVAHSLDLETNRKMSALFQESLAERRAQTPSPARVADEAATLKVDRAVACGSRPSERAPRAAPVSGSARRALPREKAIGERIGPFELEAELGRGGMGLVYRARDSRSGQQVALKLLLRGDAAKTDDVQRFQVEAKAGQALDHPNLVSVREHGQDEEGTWYMAMDYVVGEDLAVILAREGALDPEQAAEIMRDVALGLAAAHEQEVLHRDLKPHNVLIQTDGTPRLTDFGLAKVHDETTASLTASGTILGTPAYMSPEQADGNRRAVGVASDVYGLGATLYHMVTGTPPFAQESMTAVLLKIMSEEPLRPSQRVPGFDRDLETIILKCLAKDPGARYDSALDLARDLNRWLRALDIVATRPSPWARLQAWARQRPDHAAIYGVLCGALLLISGICAWSLGAASVQPALAAVDSPEVSPVSPVSPVEVLESEQASPRGAGPQEASAAEGPVGAQAGVSARVEGEALAAAESAPSEVAAAPPPSPGVKVALAPATPTSSRGRQASPSEGPSRGEPQPARGGPRPRGARPAGTPAGTPAATPAGRRGPPESHGDSPGESRTGTRRGAAAAPVQAGAAAQAALLDLDPAGPPPGWLVWRAEQLAAAGSRRAIYAPTWARAREEAQARGVPLVVLLLPADATRLPGKLSASRLRRLLNEEVVTLAAIPPHASATRSEGAGSRGEPRGGSQGGAPARDGSRGGPGPRRGPPPRGGGSQGGPPPRGGGSQGGGPRGGEPLGGGPQAGGARGDSPGEVAEADPEARCKVLSGERCGVHLANLRVAGIQPSQEARVVICDPAGRPLETFDERQLGRLESALRERIQGADSALGGAAMRQAAGLTKSLARLSGSGANAAAGELGDGLSAPALVGEWARHALQTWTQEQLAQRRGNRAALEELLEACQADPVARAWVEAALAGC